MGTGQNTLIKEQAGARPTWRCLSTRTLQVVLILLPFAYLGMLLAVVVHEALGHGLATVLLGGRFMAFIVRFDGMGFAVTLLPPEAPAWKHTVMLAAGVTSTIVSGTIFLVIAKRVRAAIISLVLIVIAINLAIEGSSYLLWNSIHAVPPGDIGLIISSSGSPLLRMTLIGLGGLLSLGFSWCSIAMLFRRLEHCIAVGGQLCGGQRAAILGLVAVLFGLPWFVFDWNLLAPGLGQLPNWSFAATGAVCAATLYPIHSRLPACPPSKRQLVGTAMVGFGLLGATILVIALWLTPG